MEKIMFSEKFDLFNEKWTPKVIAESNGHLIKLVKGDGELVWHCHENEDELFLVFKGRLTIKFRDEEVILRAGEMVVVPMGVEHCPVAEPDTHLMIIEPASTKHTGSLRTEVTVPIDKQEWI